MRKIFILLLILMITVILISKEDKIRIGITSFDDTINEASKGLGIKITNLFENNVVKINDFYIRKSNALQVYDKLFSRTMAGLTDPALLKVAGKGLMVEYITVGTVVKNKGAFEVDVRTVDVNQWNIVCAKGARSESVNNAVDAILTHYQKKCTIEYFKKRKKEASDNHVVTVGLFKDWNQMARKKSVSGLFSEILNSELGNYNMVTTIEKKFSQALVNEKILVMADVIENPSLNENLSRINVQYKLMGNVRVFKDVICLNIQLYSVKGSRMIYQGRREISSPKYSRYAARSLSGEIENVLQNKIATFNLSSNPKGATVYINRQYRGKTPLIMTVEKGIMQLTIKSDSHEIYNEKIVVKPRTIFRRNIILKDITERFLEKGMIYEQGGEYDLAIQAYDKFMKYYGETKTSHMVLYRKGHVLMFYKKEYDKSLKVFNKLLKQYPESMIRAQAYYSIAKIHAIHGEKQKAREVLKYLIDNYNTESLVIMEARELMKTL